MILTKLSAVAILARRNQVLNRLTVHGSKTLFISKNNNSTASGKKKHDDDDELDQPIKFSSSKAATWSAVASHTGVEPGHEKPWYQPWVVMFSLAVFMVYFFIMREENDIDERLTWNLGDHFDDDRKQYIEESQKVYWDYMKKRGLGNDNRRNSP